VRETGARYRSDILKVILAAAMIVVSARPAAADWTIGAFLGASWTRDTSLTLTRPASGLDVTLDPIHYAGEPWKSPQYFGYRVGYLPGSHWFGVEGELIHLKVLADVTRTTTATGTIDGVAVSDPMTVSSLVQRFSITHGVNLWFVNALFRREQASSGTTQPRWVLVGRLGAGRSIPHAESTIQGRTHDAYEWGASSLQASGAIEVRAASHFYVTAEYKLTRSPQDVTIDGGRAQTTIVTSHLATGVMYRFGR
jgi:hypothetical protein